MANHEDIPTGPFCYTRFRGDEPTLRDYLAMDRTILANERTLLAYFRTALALVIVGGSAIKFFDSLLLEVLGAVFIFLGIATLSVGVRRFVRTNRRIRQAIDVQPLAQPDHPPEKGGHHQSTSGIDTAATTTSSGSPSRQ